LILKTATSQNCGYPSESFITRERTRDCADQLVRDHPVRKGEHEEDGGVENDVSLRRASGIR